MIKETWNFKLIPYLIKLVTEAGMTYSSTVFFIFLTGFLIIYCLLRSSKARKYWILAGNLVFYMWSGYQAAAILLVTSLTVWFAALRTEKIYRRFEETKEGLTPKEQAASLKEYKNKARKYLLLSFIVTGGIWIAVKVCRYLGVPSVSTFGEMFERGGIIVPLGISYYTLSCLGYILDVFWRKTKPEHNFISFFTVVSFFPHIVQGPISKYSDVLKQVNDLPKVTYERLCFGLQLMLWGYIKKMVIADRLVLFTSCVFGAPTEFAGVEVVIAVIFSVVQIYADFSGCMDIVRGISQILGIGLAENFRQPFFAKSAQEFWTRWHISLGAWTKEYIFLFISVNPKFLKFIGKVRKKSKWWASFITSFVPLISVWLFTGLWHGTGADYIVWGLYWCALMTVSKETAPISGKLASALKIDREKPMYKVFCMVRTTLFFAIGRMFTVTGSLSGCALLWKRMFESSRIWVLFNGSIYGHELDRIDYWIAVLGIAVMLTVDILHEKGHSLRAEISELPLVIRWAIYYGAAIILVMLGMYGAGFNSSDFLYANF